MSVITKVDAAGRAFLTKQEGEVLKSYRDSGGKWTIGVGHLMSTGAAGVTITHQQSQDLLTKDLARFEAAVAKLVRVPLTQNQFNALVSFAFNLGEGALKKSNLLSLINSGRKAEAAAVSQAFKIWRNVNGKPDAGIEARRLREAALFFTP
jgi:lysozyme